MNDLNINMTYTCNFSKQFIPQPAYNSDKNILISKPDSCNSKIKSDTWCDYDEAEMMPSILYHTNRYRQTRPTVNSGEGSRLLLIWLVKVDKQ